MERLGPEEDPVRSALTSTSGKYARESVMRGYIFSTEYFLVFEKQQDRVQDSLSFFDEKLQKKK